MAHQHDEADHNSLHKIDTPEQDCGAASSSHLSYQPAAISTAIDGAHVPPASQNSSNNLFARCRTPRGDRREMFHEHKLTLFGRACAIIFVEVAVNAVVWIVSVLLWAPHPSTRPVLNLAVIAWTLGLRHAVDADHICAIDNSIRRLVATGQRPVTVGTFFSLGHSAIVIIATLIVIISADLADKVHDFGEVGGYIGVSISASFLFLIALVNAIILHRTLSARRRARLQGHAPTSSTDAAPGGWISKLARPLFKVIDRPWKLLPLGMLFGLGFDTASSILLLSVSATASTSLRNHPGELILLPLLFTAGMTAIDTLDGVVMVYAYSIDALPEKKWALFAPKEAEERERAGETDDEDAGLAYQSQKQESLMSVSIYLTAVSIGVALLVAIIEFMGLAAEQLDGGEKSGLAGSWWRFWLALDEGSGWLGIAIIGFLLSSLVVWLTWMRYGSKKSAVAVELPPDHHHPQPETGV